MRVQIRRSILLTSSALVLVLISVLSIGSISAMTLSPTSVLIAPTTHPVVSRTSLGLVLCKVGTLVCIVDTGRSVAIFDLDSARNHVKVGAGTRTITLTPGKQLVLTRDQDKFDKINPCPTIGHRSMTKEDLGRGVSAYYGEFSIVSAMFSLDPIHRIATSTKSNDKRLTTRLLKNSCIQDELSRQDGPFRTAEKL